MQPNPSAIAAYSIALFVSAAARAQAAPEEATAQPAPESRQDEAKPEQEKPEKPRSGWVALPVVSYAPETSLVLGGYVMRYFRLDEKSHDTTLGAIVTGSFKRQFTVELMPEIYFARNDYRVGAQLIAQNFPDRFFGVGNSASDTTAENYGRRSFVLRTNFRRRIAGQFYGGLTTDLFFASIDIEEPDGLLATRDYVGEEGGVSSGVGLAASYDDRDERAYTMRGAFVELLLVPYLRGFGSDYQSFRSTFDGRYFVPTWKRQALGLRYFLDAARGEVPFYLLPQFGGPNSMRGYFRGKFRDTTVHTLEAEYRAHVWWLFGAAAFAGVGQVGESFSEMVSAPLRPAVGGGVRFDLSGGDGYNLRVDAAGWPGEFGFYVAILEAF
jgi:outer membrane protein assembly factor BamA